MAKKTDYEKAREAFERDPRCLKVADATRSSAWLLGPRALAAVKAALKK